MGSGSPNILYGTWPACVSGQCGGVCAQGFHSCGGNCVDQNNDASNCGACGHGCDGGICVAGQCTTSAAIQVVSVSAQDIAVDGSNLYLADKSNNVLQFDKSTFAKTIIAGSQATPWHVTVDSSFVYWTSKLGGAVLRAPIGGGAFKVLYSANSPTGIAVDATNVYWTDAAGIHAGPKAGQATVANLSSLVPDTIAQDSTRIYGLISGLTAPATLFSVDKTTGASVVYFQDPSGGVPYYEGLAVDDVDVYYLSFNGHATTPICLLNRQSIGSPSSSGADQLYWGSSPVSQYMLAEHCLVYWSTPTVIYKQVPGGSPSYEVTTAASNATAIALDDKYLYWADQSFIGRVPK
jgi:hypothetical protein